MLFVCFVGCKAPSSFNPFNEPEARPWDGKYRDNEVLYTELDGRVDGPIPDYTKNDGTSNMCWAVAVCNVLEYTGHVASNSQCVGDMKAHYGNVPGYPVNSYNWYVQEYLYGDPRDYYSQEYDHRYLLDFIVTEVDSGRMAVLSIGPLTGNTGHVVAVYGYGVTDTGYTLYVVDGDDSKHTNMINLYWDEDEWTIHSSFFYDKYFPNYAFSISSATQ